MTPSEIDNTAFISNLTSSLNGVPLGHAISGLISAMLMLIVATKLSTEDQDAILDKINVTMKNKIKEARSLQDTN
jgi:hypothetical protein